MSTAELILRFGVNAAGWLVAVVHLLFVLLIPKTVCASSIASEPWTAATVTGLVLLPLLLLMGGARAHLHHFRWLTVVPVMMAALALLVILPYLGQTTFSGFTPCSVLRGTPQGGASILERLWAPFQILLIVLLVLRTAQAWRAPLTSGG